MKKNCTTKTLINITEGNDITINATLTRDKESFPVEMSTNVTAALIAIGVNIPLEITIPSAGVVTVEVPSTVAPGNYVLGISGELAGQNWRTASEVLRITTITEEGQSDVTVVGDDYDITMEVQLYSADIANAIERHNTDEEAHPYILQQLGTKQDTISDLQTIREGAAAGATAYQLPAEGIPASDMDAAVNTSLDKADTAYQLPNGGIPSTDLSSGVNTSLEKADSAYQKPSGGIPESDIDSTTQGKIDAGATAYQKPSSGIPSTDMTSAVQTSLGKADTAVQASDIADSSYGSDEKILSILGTVIKKMTPTGLMNFILSKLSPTDFVSSDYIIGANSNMQSKVANMDSLYKVITKQNDGKIQLRTPVIPEAIYCGTNSNDKVIRICKDRFATWDLGYGASIIEVYLGQAYWSIMAGKVSIVYSSNSYHAEFQTPVIYIDEVYDNSITNFKFWIDADGYVYVTNPTGYQYGWTALIHKKGSFAYTYGDLYEGDTTNFTEIATEASNGNWKKLTKDTYGYACVSISTGHIGIMRAVCPTDANVYAIILLTGAKYTGYSTLTHIVLASNGVTVDANSYNSRIAITPVDNTKELEVYITRLG